MPLLNLYLIALDKGTTAAAFTNKVQKDKPDLKVVLAARPHHWVVKPTILDSEKLLGQRWDLMLLTEGAIVQSSEADQVIKDIYSMKVGVPRKLHAEYSTTNARLLSQAQNIPLTGALDTKLDPVPADSQKLELSDDLRRFMEEFTQSRKINQPVTMLNLLCFKPNSQKQYATYGQHFQTAGGRRGGNAKIVGSVVRDDSKASKKGWDEIALVHYPSIQHFCDMAAGADYQDINRTYRLPSLEDTILLCTTEMQLKPASKL
ncbi:Hypothetical protein D9617_5g071250 [Elsinoe fawcettii]|nr:Hypothetical protein D9617_5g071250 [Elsinoe fawcettii]